MAYESSEREIPEVDVTKLDNISSIVTTFESKDLVTRNVIGFLHDPKTDYVFIDFWSYVNGKPVKDILAGFDKDKILTACKNIIDFFEDKQCRTE